MDVMQKLRARVAELREMYGMRQTDLAEAAGVHVNTIIRIEGGGAKTVGVVVLENIASALSVTLTELVSD